MTEAQKKRRAQADQGINRMVIATLMGTVDGRRWIWLRLAAGHVFSQTVDLTPSGHAVMSFREGQRSQALELLTDVMSLAPQQFVNMLTENGSQKEKADDRHDRSSGSSADTDAFDPERTGSGDAADAG